MTNPKADAAAAMVERYRIMARALYRVGHTNGSLYLDEAATLIAEQAREIAELRALSLELLEIAEDMDVTLDIVAGIGNPSEESTKISRIRAALEGKP